MTMQGIPHLDRRRTHRVPLRRVTARCASSSTIGLYAVRDLSMGGVLLEGEPLLGAGTKVRLQLAADGVTRGPMLRGSVLRMESDIDSEFAVGFGVLSADEEDTIEEIVVGQLATECRSHVLLATASVAERTRLSHSLHRLGYDVLEADSALDVVALMADPDTRPEAVVLGSQFSGGTGLELASFLADAYPRVRRILVARDSIRLRTQASGIVHAILSQPWTDAVLSDVMVTAR